MIISNNNNVQFLDINSVFFPEESLILFILVIIKEHISII